MVNKQTIWSYLEPFTNTSDSLHLVEISRLLKKPHPTVRSYLNLLEKEGVLLKSTKGRLTLYRMNIHLPNIIDYLVLAEKEKLVKNCKNDLILAETVSFLHNNLSEQNKALLFGSCTVDSKEADDFDLLIIGKTSINSLIIELEKKLNKKIHLINVETLKDVGIGLKAEIFKKHLMVQGSEEFVKWLT